MPPCLSAVAEPEEKANANRDRSMLTGVREAKPIRSKPTTMTNPIGRINGTRCLGSSLHWSSERSFTDCSLRLSVVEAKGHK